MDAVVAKFQCHLKDGKAESVGDSYSTCRLLFGAVWEGTEEKQAASENAIFGKWSPSGSLEIRIANPPAAEFFVQGKKYYITFTEAPD